MKLCLAGEAARVHTTTDVCPIQLWRDPDRFTPLLPVFTNYRFGTSAGDLRNKPLGKRRLRGVGHDFTKLFSRRGGRAGVANRHDPGIPTKTLVTRKKVESGSKDELENYMPRQTLWQVGGMFR